MKKQLLTILTVIGFAAGFVFPALGDDLEALDGKWTVQKTNEEGQKFTQHIEVNKGKFKFKIVGGDGQTRLYAEGDVKVDKAGPFKTIVFSNIQAGESSSDLNPIDDTYTSIYRIGEEGWTVLMNFDKDRDQQKPSMDVYKKAK